MEFLSPEIRNKEGLLIPETSDGFDFTLETQVAGIKPVSYYEPVLDTGAYQIYIKLAAVEDIEDLYIFTGRKCLVYLGALKAGEVLEKTFYTHVSDIIPRYHASVHRQRYVMVTFACQDTAALQPMQISVRRPDKQIPVIYLAGDSTVTDQSSEYPYHPGACYSSWGQDLPLYIKGDYVVDNQAHCGLTTETFRNEGHYKIILSYLRSGDYCIFQFGHNDQKRPYLQAETGYRQNLVTYVEEIRERGAIPVLVTPLARNTWNEDGSYLDLLKEHSAAVKQITIELQVPIIDLHDRAMEEIIRRGFMEATCLFHPGDMTHTNEYGSAFFAKVIAEGLMKILPEGEAQMDLTADNGFEAPLDLWEQLKRVTNNRKSGVEEKEQFDIMEKSIANLVKAVRDAREQAK